MSQLGRSLQLLDIGKDIRRVCEPDASRRPKNHLWNIGISAAISVINSRVTGKPEVISCHKADWDHRPSALRLRDLSLAPAGLFIQADIECGFRHYFMREERISGMDSAQTRIADQSLVTG